MSGSPPSFLPVVAAVLGILCTALVGCGSGGDPVSGAVLQQRLVAAADRIDACFAKTNDARKCADAEALGDASGALHLGDGVGEVRVSATKPLRYHLVADAGDDVEFAILVQPIGARKRVCKPAGQGECSKDGVW